ncbi:MAG: phenylacetate--CoA ligase family protein [Chloroflexi bacterium]|nr:phenylacetate--CoA ligase family protein [Chloroflexota bacterium]
MRISAPSTQIVGDVPARTREQLRDTLLYARSTFSVYAALFDDAGISIANMTEQEPLSLLQRLPLLESDSLSALTDECIRSGENIIDMETSSGTTGPRKRRFITHEDDLSETKFLAELFRVCEIGESDSVACLDTDPLTLMVSFTKALDLLGTQEAYAYCVGSDFNRALEGLPKLNPSVIISVPSIIERCFDALKLHYENKADSRLRKIIYVGEPLSAQLRGNLETVLGVEVFGYYGASETSALGIECSAHDGIHLFTDRNIIELISPNPESDTSEIVVTTLRQQSPPLLRYALKDVVRVKPGACPCGLQYPRVEVIGRAGDSFSILGAKISYAPILNAAYGPELGPRLMQLVVTQEDRDRLTIVLPDALRGDEAAIRRSLMASQPDLDFLVGSRYLDLGFSFVDESYFGESRKQKRVVDRRNASAENE